MPGGGFVQPNRLYLQRSQPLAGAGVAMNHRRYIAYTVVRNGCSGGNLPPLAARPLVGRLYPYHPTEPAPRRGWMALGQRRYIVPCIGLYHSTEQVVFGRWRAAGCRPYNIFVTNYRVFNVSIIVLRPYNIKNVVH